MQNFDFWVEKFYFWSKKCDWNWKFLKTRIFWPNYLCFWLNFAIITRKMIFLEFILIFLYNFNILKWIFAFLKVNKTGISPSKELKSSNQPSCIDWIYRASSDNPSINPNKEARKQTVYIHLSPLWLSLGSLLKGFSNFGILFFIWRQGCLKISQINFGIIFLIESVFWKI